MGLLKKIFGNRRIDPPHRSQRQPRICRYEEIEARRMMAADLHVGSVYYEQASGDDLQPNILQFTFEGGAAGTQLTRITIDGDKDGKGISAGDIFFDTAPGGHGVFRSNPLKIVSHDGFQVTGTQVVDGGMKLVFDLEGFDVGETLVISIDVDEFQFIDEVTGDIDINAVAEGAEFQRSKFITEFKAPHYEDLTKTVLFWDAYNKNFADAEAAAGSHLDLPPDRYTANLDLSDLTAGAVAVATQVPLPNSISGVVYLDHDLDNTQDPGDTGIGGVNLTLLVLTNGTYVSTGKTTVTDAQGHYKFNNLPIGTFRVVETQPGEYLSVGSTPGKVNGVTRGTVTTVDILSGINLLGGEDSIRNDFAEYLPVSISGRVHLNTTGDCDNPANPPIANVKIELLNAVGQVIDTTFTNADGFYIFDNLKPGTYGVHEIQPEGLFSAKTYVGTAGGVKGDDIVTSVVLTSGVDGLHYDFCELPPASISGFVYYDVNNNGVKDPGEVGISGATLMLKDANGNLTGATTITDTTGFYQFTGLRPGTYGVGEAQPSGYLDGLDSAGSAGGAAMNPGDMIMGAVLTGGLNAVNYNFGELRPASISGRVHLNTTGDCLDPANPPISGVTVQLLNSAGQVIDTRITDANGFYEFANLAPGVYSVRELQPAGYFSAATFVGTAGGIKGDDLVTQITLGSGVNGLHYDFCELPPGSISGRVHLNTTGDCLDPANPPISNVKIELLNGNGIIIATTFTNSDGYYEFTGLAPGEYSVHEIQPEGYFSAATFVGSAGGVKGDDWVTEISIGAGVDGVHYDFCELPPVSLSGFVHVVVNGDCEDFTNNPPIAGVRIELLSDSGIVIATTFTDGNGFYKFSGLRPGTYGVHEVQPAGYLDSGDHVGSAGGTLSNDLITEIFLPILTDAVQYNFCEVLPDEQIILPPPPGPPEPPPLPGFLFIPPPEAPLLRPDNPFLVPPVLTRAGGQLYTWHLSVVDAGYPRGPLADSVVQLTAMRAGDEKLWRDAELDEVDWTLAVFEGDEMVTRKLRFGKRGGIPVSGDFNGDGKFEVGLFYDGYWFIDLNGNSVWDEGDLWAKLGTKDDKPVTGDWNGDGKTDIGIYGPAWRGDPRAVAHEPGMPDPYNENTARQKNIPREQERNAVGHRELRLTAGGRKRSDLVDHVFFYGTPGDHPIVGDWNGDGIPTIAVFRDGKWHRDVDGDGKNSKADQSDNYGGTSDIPLVGDFNGDGVQELAVFRDGTWYVDTNGNGTIDGEDQTFQLGGSGDTPVVGDWNGDGRSEPGVFHDNSARRRR